jgi:molecular chaperone DnaK (HSP70)
VETRSIVGFRGKDRLFGDSASALSATFPEGCAVGVKRLLGAWQGEAATEEELALHHRALEVVSEGSCRPTFRVPFQEGLEVIPEQIAAMLLSKARVQAETALGHKPIYAVAVPATFTKIQNRAVLDSCKIAGLADVCVVDDGTATALCYAFKRELPVKPIPPMPVLLVDVGNSYTRMTLVTLSDKEVVIVARANDANLGTRDLDLALFQAMADKFKADTQLDVSESRKACGRLLKECERAKNILSANTEVEVRAESLMAERDLSARVTRADFERLPGVARVLERFQACLTKLNLAKVAADNRATHVTVEVLGGGMRVPCLRAALSAATGMELSSTLDAATSVAIGAALFAGVKRNLIAYTITDMTGAQASSVPKSLTGQELADFAKVAKSLDDHDDAIRRTRDTKNSVEAYIYSAKDRLKAIPSPSGPVTEAIALLDQAEEWLYKDGEDVDIKTYEAYLKDLKDKIGAAAGEHVKDL